MIRMVRVHHISVVLSLLEYLHIILHIMTATTWGYALNYAIIWKHNKNDNVYNHIIIDNSSQLHVACVSIGNMSLTLRDNSILPTCFVSRCVCLTASSKSITLFCSILQWDFTMHDIILDGNKKNLLNYTGWH